MIKDNLIGQRFGRLVVLEEADERRCTHVCWCCICDCGATKVIAGNHLKSGKISSCGCYQKERTTKHGDNRAGKRERLYSIWKDMKTRCYKAKTRGYKYYGGKGVTVCNEWKNNYSAFKFWALLSGYQANLTIDRINNNGDYEPSNCQWITRSENFKKAKSERWRKFYEKKLYQSENGGASKRRKPWDARVSVL